MKLFKKYYKNNILSIGFLCTVLQATNTKKYVSRGANVLNKKHDIDMIVGKSLAKHRIACGLTQAQVAEKLGFSVDSISRMERGTISLTLPRLMQFAELFECQLSDFIVESSPLPNEQLSHLTKMIEPLSEHKRRQLIELVENMVAWYNDDK